MAGSGPRREAVISESLIVLLEGFRKSFQLVIHLLLASRQENQVKEENRPDDNIAEKKVGHTPSTHWTERLIFICHAGIQTHGHSQHHQGNAENGHSDDRND